MWNKELWHSKRNSVETNDYGAQVELFDNPNKYMINYQPVSGYTDFLEYGEKIHDMYRAYVDRNQYEGVFNVGDRVYLIDGQLSQEDLQKVALYDNKYRNRANYIVYAVMVQNFKIKIDFMKRRNIMVETIKMTKNGEVKYISAELESDYAKLGWVRVEEPKYYSTNK